MLEYMFYTLKIGECMVMLVSAVDVTYLSGIYLFTVSSLFV